MQPLTHSTPFLTSITVKPDCVDEYMKLAKETDSAVEASEPGMLHHTFDNDVSGGPTQFVWSEVYANDAAFMAHISNPPVGEHLTKHAELATHFEDEFFERVWVCVCV